MTIDGAKAYMDAKTDNKLMHATVGPLDVLSIPCGWTFWEKIHNNDFYGVRSVHLRAADLATLDSINKYLIACEAPNATLTRAVDCLAMAG